MNKELGWVGVIFLVMFGHPFAAIMLALMVI